MNAKCSENLLHNWAFLGLHALDVVRAIVFCIVDWGESEKVHSHFVINEFKPVDKAGTIKSLVVVSR